MPKPNPLEDFDFSPFEPQSLIAQGGSARIVLAKGPDGGLVALKVARRKAHAFSQVRREHKALAALADPAGRVVRLKSPLMEGPPPWFALEFVPGQRLSQHIEESMSTRSDWVSTTLPRGSRPQERSHSIAPRGKSPDREHVQQLLRLMSGLAECLAFVHEGGFRHGDLTPANVLLREDQSPVLIDFGSASREHDSQLAREQPHDGLPAFATRGYVSPEVHAGHLSDVRSDIYSLGCIYCAMIMGEPPALGTLPHLPRWLPAWVSELLSSTLEPEPMRRTPSARAVAECFNQQKGPVSIQLQPNDRALSVRARTVGRDPTLQYLRSHVAELFTGRGQLVMVLGEAGIGKTRVLNELSLMASREGTTTLAVSCLDPDNVNRSQVPAIAEAVNVWQRANSLPRLPLLDRLLSSPAQHPNASASEEGAELKHLERVLLLDELFGLLVEQSRLGPIVVAVDDVQWADDFTLAFLQSERVVTLIDHGVLVVVLGRPEPISSDLATLFAQHGTTLQLRRLATHDVAQLASDLLGGEQVPQGLDSWLQQRTEGNPLYVTEFIRSLVASRTLVRGPGGWILTSQLLSGAKGAEFIPGSLTDLLDQRLLSVRPQTRKVARLAAALDFQFTREDVETLARGVWAFDPLEVRRTLDELTEIHVLQHAGLGQLRFSHALYRERCHHLQVGMDTREFSRRLATEYEANPLLSARDNSTVTTGGLWAAAGEPQKAFEQLRLAAEAELALHKVGSARKLLERAMVQFHEMPELSQVALATHGAHTAEQLAQLLHNAACYADAVSGYSHAMSLWPNSDPTGRARTLRKQGVSLTCARHYDRARQVYDRAQAELDRFDKEPDSAWWGEWIEVRLARLWLDYYAAATPGDIDGLRSKVEARGSASQRSHFLQCLSAYRLRASGFGECPDAVQDAEEALRQIEASAGLSLRKPEAQLDVAFPLLWSGREHWPRARDLLEEAQRGASWADDITLLAKIRTYLSIAHRRLSQLDQVERTAKLALSTAERTNSPSYKGAALGNLAWVCWKRGELEQASQFVTDARHFWNDGALRFPFQFLVTLVWMDLLRLEEDFAAACRAGKSLLDDDLHRLPPELGDAIDALDPGQRPAAIDRALLGVTVIAQKLGYV